MFRTLLIVTASLITSVVKVNAQSDTVAVKSIKGITDKMLELISVPLGGEPNWDEYRNLFLPTSQKYSLNPDARPGREVRSMNLEEFIRNVGPLFGRDGFKEVSIGLTFHQYNGVAIAFQAYHAKNLLGTYEKRGVNTYQLVYKENRWWIVNGLFVNEDPENKIPEEYIKTDDE